MQIVFLCYLDQVSLIDMHYLVNLIFYEEIQINSTKIGQAKNKYKSVSVSRRTPLKRKYKADKEKAHHSVMNINPSDD